MLRIKDAYTLSVSAVSPPKVGSHQADKSGLYRWRISPAYLSRASLCSLAHCWHIALTLRQMVPWLLSNFAAMLRMV